MYLQQELTQLKNATQFEDQFNLNVSKAGSYWQIDHSLKTILTVLNLLEKRDTPPYRWRLNLARTFVFTLNYIPRGIGKAPKSVLPPELILKQDLITQYDLAVVKTQNIDQLDSKTTFMHPYFGQLNFKQTLRFLKIHTKHHLKIINELLKDVKS